MTYVLALIAALLAVFIVALVIGSLANVLSLIPRAGVRKWIVIVPTLFFGFQLIAVTILMIVYKEDVRAPFRMLRNVYQSLPSTTIVLGVPAAAAAISLIVFTIWAFLPVKGEPYTPRGVPWSLGWLLKRIGLLVVALLLAVIVQDFELRWRLNRLELRADQLAAEFQPPAVPDQENAAIHYQRIMKLTKASEISDDEEKLIDGLLDQSGPFDEEALKFFQAFEPMLAEFKAAAKCKTARFPDTTIPKTLLDETEPRIHESSAFGDLYRYAQFQICQQRPHEAVECIRIFQAWTLHLQADPRYVNATHYRQACGLTLALVQSLVNSGTAVSADDLRSILTDPLTLDSIHQAAVEWERMSCFKSIPLAYDGTLYQSPRLNDVQFLGSESATGKIARVVMRFLFARDDLAAIQAQFAPLETKYDKATWRYAGCDDRLEPVGQLTRSLTSISVQRWPFEMAESDRRLCNIAIAAEFYRQAHGAWPRELSQLAPTYLAEVPLDPETDTPYAFKAIENGVAVWANQLTKYLDKADSEGKFWEETAQISGPILFLGDALRLSKAASAPAPGATAGSSSSEYGF